ncbi:thiamine-phosphate kinase [Brevibacillus massiliensis]|uniref:thiamine-phosphate kinase n=1 Tax=Brevibacillus massiliensis TaxID=1118054 RepID=UPI0004751980|nr:thiamine-phosphate kinase [Brevibacillus massiliensis]
MSHDEFSLIREWTKRGAQHAQGGLSVGIGDDAAVFTPPPGMQIVACCDTMIETVHFLRETMQPEDIGYKALVSNVSDIAAMGGIPRYALVSIGISSRWSPPECRRIYDGMYEACERYGVQIIGGDTVSTPDALYLSITVLGEVETGRALLRSGARPGDAIFVTGPVGGSAAGLAMLLKAKAAGGEVGRDWKSVAAFHQRPEAQVKAGRLLLASGLAGALNDVSDGLASELWEIAEASGVRMLIERDKIPLDREVKAYAASVGQDPLAWALFGGEDYQLVGTVRAASPIAEQFSASGLPLYLIGRVEPGAPGVWLADQEGCRPLEKGGYNHFA